jgi:hypothetical protein
MLVLIESYTLERAARTGRHRTTTEPILDYFDSPYYSAKVGSRDLKPKPFLVKDGEFGRNTKKKLKVM